MSLILDALRKMEQERRSRRGAGQDLRPEVLRYRTAAQPKERARYPLAVVAGAVLLCAGLAAGFLLKGHAPGTATVATPVAAPASQPPVAAALPTAPVATTPAPVPAAPVTAAPVAAAQPPVALPAEQPRKAMRAAAAVQTPVQPDAAPLRAAREDAVSSPAGGQDITISGIAYQDERRLRRAVLNGALVGEGAEVAGARVVEIKETKVRLSRGGQVFEVPFSSGLQSR